MYHVDDKAYTWSHTVHGRGKRTTPVGQGVFVIDHIGTGKIIIGQSRTVSNDVDRHIELLKAGNHPNKKMVKLVSMCEDLRLIEYPVKNAKEGKALEARIRASNDTPYLLLN